MKTVAFHIAVNAVEFKKKQSESKHGSNVDNFSFHFISKFFKEGNPSAKMLVFKGPSN